MSLLRLKGNAAALHGQLLADLHTHAEGGAPAPCVSDPAPFVSDSPLERAAAAEACTWCPALKACATYASTSRETDHVWGGRDRTRDRDRSVPTTAERSAP